MIINLFIMFYVNIPMQGETKVLLPLLQSFSTWRYKNTLHKRENLK